MPYIYGYGPVMGNTAGPADTSSNSVIVASPTPTGFTLDSRTSTYGGEAIGGSLGTHALALSTTKLKLAPYTATAPVATTAGANVDYDSSSDMYSKNISGNLWNSYFKSTDPIVTPGVDCIVSWLIEDDFDGDGDTGTGGTIREMGGLDDNPDSNSSYNTGEYMVYQVNATTVYLYEKGTNKGSVSRPMVVGDRLGLRVINNVVEAIHIRDGVITSLITSDTLLDKPMYFKGAINRGVGSSGHGSMGDVQVFTDMEEEVVSTYIYGNSSELIKPVDVIGLNSVGLAPSNGATYSYLNLVKDSSYKFPTGEYAITHTFSVPTSQSIVTVS